MVWKSIFFGGISLPSTDITHIRITHALKSKFLNNALRRRKVDFPDHWCGRMKKENYWRRDVTVSDLPLNKNVSLPLFWGGKMFKLVIYRPSFITSFENRRVKNDSEQLEIHDSRSTTSRWHLMMMKNDSADVDRQRLRGTAVTHANVLST